MFSTEHLNYMHVIKCHNTAHHKYVKTITKRPVQQQAFVLYSVSAQLTDTETRVSRHSVSSHLCIEIINASAQNKTKLNLKHILC